MPKKSFFSQRQSRKKGCGLCLCLGSAVGIDSWFQVSGTKDKKVSGVRCQQALIEGFRN
jgi:hypothetical protein